MNFMQATLGNVYRRIFASFPAVSRLKMENSWGTPADHGYTLRSAKAKIDKKLTGGLQSAVPLAEDE